MNEALTFTQQSSISSLHSATPRGAVHTGLESPFINTHFSVISVIGHDHSLNDQDMNDHSFVSMQQDVVEQQSLFL